jgi:microcystin-dependent protein
MPPDRHLADATPAETPSHGDVQQLIEAESGKGAQGVVRAWQASNSPKVVLTSDAGGVKISRDDGTTAPAQVIVDGTTAGGALGGTYPSPVLATATVDGLLPVGVVWPYAGTVAPAGWLLCNGQAVSRTTYAKLWAAIGATYGAGDGSTTFNVPNLVGRVPLGVAAAHPIGSSGGSETAAGPVHTHPGSHQHGQAGHTHGIGGHGHTMSHTHALGGHTHGLAGHSHTTNIDHDHPAFASASPTGVNGLATAGGVNLPTDTHTHQVNVPPLGTASVTSSGSSVASDGPSAASDGASPAGTGGASPATSDPASPSLTDADATAPAAQYPGTIPTLSPFLALSFIIRTG